MEGMARRLLVGPGIGVVGAVAGSVKLKLWKVVSGGDTST